MTLLKDNNYRNINTALLSLENDIKTRTAEFDTSVIDKQLADINKRIDEINVGDNSNNAEINDIRVSIDDINRGIDDINRDIDDIEQQLANIFSTKNFVEDFDTVTEPGIYYWNVNSSNRPAEYGVLLVNEYNGGSDSRWINQTAYGINGQIYFRQKINDGAWTSWKAIAFEDTTKTYTIPEVTTATTRHIKLGTFPWNFTETVKVSLSGANFEDTVEFNVLGGNANTASVNGWYTTNDGKTTGIYVVPVAPITYSSNIEVWLRVEQLTTLTVKLTGSTKAAQYFNTNPQMDYTTTVPSGAKTAATLYMERGFFGYNENTLNCYETTMVGLGFTQNQVVTVQEFAQALVNYTGINRGQVHFTWADATRAYIKATTPYNTQLDINGGTIIFHSRYKNVGENWNIFNAQYIDRAGNLYTFGIQRDNSTTTEYVRKEVDTSTTNALRTNADEGYLCKLYSKLKSATSNSTNQAYNVMLLGKIPDPASTAGPATPSSSWDIDIDIWFVRPQGHKAAWCNVKAGYGYSNAWRKYGSIETFGVDTGSNYTNPFSLVTLKYNDEYYIGIRHYVNIDGNYAARINYVNTMGNRNPTTVANTSLANVLTIIPFKSNTETVYNSEINSSIANLPVTYAPTTERNGCLTIKNDTDVSLSSYGQEPLSIGVSSGYNLGIDSNEIQARYGSAVGPLFINGSGGMVYINDINASSGGLKVKGHLNIPVGAPTNPAKGDIWLVL